MKGFFGRLLDVEPKIVEFYFGESADEPDEENEREFAPDDPTQLTLDLADTE